MDINKLLEYLEKKYQEACIIYDFSDYPLGYKDGLAFAYQDTINIIQASRKS